MMPQMDVYTDTARDDDPECGCGHPLSMHDGPAGECTGKGEYLDAMYGVPPGEACICPRYSGSVD